MSKGQTSGDATGWKRGEKGYASDSGKGTHRQWDKAGAMGVDFDDKKLYGPTHGREEVGARAVTGGKYGSDHD